MKIEYQTHWHMSRGGEGFPPKHEGSFLLNGSSSSTTAGLWRREKLDRFHNWQYLRLVEHHVDDALTDVGAMIANTLYTVDDCQQTHDTLQHMGIAQQSGNGVRHL